MSEENNYPEQMEEENLGDIVFSQWDVGEQTETNVEETERDIEQISYLSETFEESDGEAVSNPRRLSRMSTDSFGDQMSDVISTLLDSETINNGQETMLNRCIRLLEEINSSDMLDSDESDDFFELNIFLADNNSFIEEVLDRLRNSGPVTLSGVSNLIVLAFEYPVPDSMRDSFCILEIPEDGNSFYNAISVALFGTMEYMIVLRFAALVIFIRQRIYFRDWVGKNIIDSFNEVLHKISRNGDSADEYSQLAVSIAIDKPIVIYTVYPIEVLPSPWHKERIKRSAITVRLVGNHFSPVIPLTDEAEREGGVQLCLNYIFVEGELVDRFPTLQ